MNIGFIGLGLMGTPMCKNLLKAGHTVTVWNRTLAKSEALRSDGAIVAVSPKAVAQNAEVTITMVTDSPDVEEVILGNDGVLGGVKPASVVIDMSTISPFTTQKLAASLQERDVELLDAPVSGGVWGAESGSLSIMVGGSKEVFDQCQGIFKDLGKRITYCGASGMGQVTKLVNQIIVAGTLAAVSEGLTFAAKAGADLDAVLEAGSGGAASSLQLENLGPRIISGDFEPGFRVRLQQKDLRIIMDSANNMNLPLITTPLVQQMFRVLERTNRGEEGTQAYIKVIEELGGVEARRSLDQGTE